MPRRTLGYISEEAMAEQYKVPGVWKNGPRVWTVGYIYLPVEPELDFDGLKARWFAYPNCPPNIQELGITAGAYRTSMIERSTKMVFKKGNPISFRMTPTARPGSCRPTRRLWTRT